MRFGFAFLAAALLGLSSPGLADVRAHYASSRPDGPTLTVAVADDGRVLIDWRGPDDIQLITRDGVRYVVAGDREGRLVARLEDFFDLERERRGTGRGEGRVSDQPRSWNPDLVVVEGATEMIAGYQGRVYAVEFADREGRRPFFEIVLSTDSTLAPVGREISRFVDQFVSDAAELGDRWQPFDQLRELAGRGTPLRVDASFRLESLSTDPLPDSTFELPGPVLDRNVVAARRERNPRRDSSRMPASSPGNAQVPLVVPIVPAPVPAQDK